MTDKELLEQFQLLAGMIQENREEIKASESRIKVFVEPVALHIRNRGKVCFATSSQEPRAKA